MPSNHLGPNLHLNTSTRRREIYSIFPIQSRKGRNQNSCIWKLKYNLLLSFLTWQLDVNTQDDFESQVLRMAEVRYTLSLLYWGQFLAENKHKLKKHTEVGGSQARPTVRLGVTALIGKGLQGRQGSQEWK